MAVDLNPSDALVDAVLRYVEPVLQAGLPEDHQAWARKAYADAVIPARLRVSVPLSDEELIKLAELVAADIAVEMDRWPPGKRWLAIVSAYYASLIGPLSQAAFDLAEAALVRTDDAPGLGAEAGLLRLQIEAISDELKLQPVEVQAAFSGELSEALLDCLYAGGNGHLMSLRLGALTTPRFHD